VEYHRVLAWTIHHTCKRGNTRLNGEAAWTRDCRQSGHGPRGTGTEGL